MNTREKILDQARRLFNDRGLTTITMRHIAEALGISLGNLTYHFQKREDLVMAIYQELVTKMNSVMEELMHEKSAFVQIHRGALRSMEMFYEYRFFLIDLVFIMRNYPEIQRHYMQLQVQREYSFWRYLTSCKKQAGCEEPKFPWNTSIYTGGCKYLAITGSLQRFPWNLIRHQILFVATTE